MPHRATQEITDLILKAANKARQEIKPGQEKAFTNPVKWPIDCLVGPGLEGAIACESEIGYVNGSSGELIYRGYNVFDLCAYSNFEEVSYLLIHGSLPTATQFKKFKKDLVSYRFIPKTMRTLMSFPVEEMNAMAALRLGSNLLRQEFSYVDQRTYRPDSPPISADEDSIPMETLPMGEKHAIYEFKNGKITQRKNKFSELNSPSGLKSCYQLISGVAAVAAAVSRMRQGHLPIEADPDLSHAANLLYMLTGRKPTAVEERIMDVALILHADHGMNASTFATMVVASTLSDLYFAVGSGIAALNGPLHGGANEQVLHMLEKIGSVNNVKDWYQNARSRKDKIMGFGHRVYKAYDPRARILGPLARYLVEKSENKRSLELLNVATKLEKIVVETLGVEKKIFPNVDFYSGIVYSCMGISADLFTPIFAVSRVSGWTSRVLEYLKNNRIFRPRAVYVGKFDLGYLPLNKRKGEKSDKK